MLRFGVSNLRRLKNVQRIDLRAINILVGRNSSGKSSFLRSFPLLRQSLMTRTSSPILWYGDFVDFGSFQGSVSDNDTGRTIHFMFGLDDITITSRTQHFSPDFGFFGQRDQQVGAVDVTVSVTSYEQRTRLSSFTLSLLDRQIEFDVHFDEAGSVTSILLQKEAIEPLYKHVQMQVQTGTIFPEIIMRPREESSAGIYFQTDAALATPMVDLLKPHLDKRISHEVISELAFQLISLAATSDDEFKALAEKTNNRSFRKFINDILNQDVRKVRNEITKIHTASLLGPLTTGVFRRLRSIFSETLYIGPARARSERYYRYQDLAVSEIDPDGKNFPMFLNSLSNLQLSDFSKWVKDRFGYGVKLDRPQGHISINLEEGGTTTNVVDTGYGISQILPVLGQIWWASNRRRPRNLRQIETGSSILLIEQPELHLHPAHQALLADSMVGERLGVSTGQQGQTSIQFIVETHSESLVNRLGELISEGRVSASDIQILLFEPDPRDSGSTAVRRAEFDRDGVLTNWPYGFFQPSP